MEYRKNFYRLSYAERRFCWRNINKPRNGADGVPEHAEGWDTETLLAVISVLGADTVAKILKGIMQKYPQVRETVGRSIGSVVDTVQKSTAEYFRGQSEYTLEKWLATMEEIRESLDDADISRLCQRLNITFEQAGRKCAFYHILLFRLSEEFPELRGVPEVKTAIQDKIAVWSRVESVLQRKSENHLGLPAHLNLEFLKNIRIEQPSVQEVHAAIAFVERYADTGRALFDSSPTDMQLAGVGMQVYDHLQVLRKYRLSDSMTHVIGDPLHNRIIHARQILESLWKRIESKTR